MSCSGTIIKNDLSVFFPNFALTFIEVLVMKFYLAKR